jgi:hypothetical protein
MGHQLGKVEGVADMTPISIVVARLGEVQYMMAQLEVQVGEVTVHVVHCFLFFGGLAGCW